MFAPFEDSGSPLIRATAADGAQFVFVILPDQRCAVTRNGDVIFSAPSSAAGIDQAIDVLVRGVECQASIGAG